jgi:hypothetical protein
LVVFHQPAFESSVSSSGKILQETTEVAFSDLSKFGGTNLYLLHVVLLQCIEETLFESNHEVTRARHFYDLDHPLKKSRLAMNRGLPSHTVAMG